MPDLCVAAVTLDLMIGDMHAVHKFRGILRRQEFWLVVTLDAFIVRDGAIPLVDPLMTLHTEDPSLDVLPVVESHPFDLEIAFWLHMARPAIREKSIFLLVLKTRIVKVTDKTVPLGHGEVGTLNNLGVTGGAAQLLPPPQFVEVPAVIEGHVLEYHFAPKGLNFMASLLEAGRIAYLRMRLGRALPGDK